MLRGTVYYIVTKKNCPGNSNIDWKNTNHEDEIVRVERDQECVLEGALLKFKEGQR